jgi:hypothetical protein
MRKLLNREANRDTNDFPEIANSSALVSLSLSLSSFQFLLVPLALHGLS